jgi:cytidylate kinase
MTSSIEAIIERQIRRWELERQLQIKEKPKEERRIEFRPVITVSRQHGSLGRQIAQKLAERFHYTLLHRDIIHQICTSSGYKRSIIEALDEHSRSEIGAWFEGIVVGSYVDHTDYFRQLSEVIYSVSKLGGVVVVGRGANFIVGPEHGFHIRVIAPRDVRVRELMRRPAMTEKDAGKEIDDSDRERADFVKRHFGKSIDDPLYYDLMINQVAISPDTAVSLIAVAAMEKFERLRGVRSL